MIARKKIGIHPIDAEKPLYTTLRLIQYHCRKCFISRIPRNQQLPEKCGGCGSKKWKISVNCLEECIYCGHYWDRRDYDLRPNNCPKCHKSDYTRQDWERKMNLNRDIIRERTQAIKDWKKKRREEKNAQKPKVIEWKKNVENIGERLGI